MTLYSLCYSALISLIMLMASSCVYAKESVEVPDSRPLISTQELESLSQSCQQDVLALHGMRKQVAPNTMKEYGITLSNASQACEQLGKAVEELRKVRKYKEKYEKNMMRAKACAGQGNSLNMDSSISSEPLIDPLASPQDPGHIDSAPLPLDTRGSAE